VDDQKKQKGFDPGFPEVDPSGAFQYQYPINLPSGTNNMAPNLTLFYNSNSPNGMIGMGWNLNGITKIERDYSYPVTYNDTTDHFMYNGEKLILDANGYYHPAKESYERIQLVNPNSTSSNWVITQKNGTKMYFGYQASEHTASTDGRIEGLNITGNDKAIVWSLSKVMDLQANYYVIEYIIDGSTGAYYPTRITYTKNVNFPLAKNRTVEFSYETRTDHAVMYNPTYTDMQRRMKWITVKIDGQLLRKYRLDYEYGTSTGRNRLNGIQQYGNDGNYPSQFWVDASYIPTGTILPAQTFNWQEGNIGTFTEVYASHNGLNGYGFGNLADRAIPFDYNGDGKMDLLLCHPGTGGFFIERSNGDGTFTGVYTSHNGLNGYPFGSTEDQAIPFDYNGDGKMDLLLCHPGSGRFTIERSNGDGTFTEVYTSHNGLNGYPFGSTEDQAIPFDYNGDGKMDLLLCHPGSGRFTIERSNGDGTFTEVYTSHNGLNGYPFGSTEDRAIPFDYNGDGKMDLLLCHPGTGGFFIERSNGDGTFTEVYTSHKGLNGYPFVSSADQAIPFDYNGDGKMDLLLCQPGTGGFFIERSNGNGTFTEVYASHKGLNGYPFGSLADQAIPFDYNGDGKMDLLLCQSGTGAMYIEKSSEKSPDLLIRIINQGGSMNIIYSSSPQVSGSVNSLGKTYPNIANSAPTPLVTDVIYDDGRALPTSQMKYHYDYSNWTMHTGLPSEWANLGFDYIEKTDENTGSSVRTYYYKDLTNPLYLDFSLLVSKVETYGALPAHALYLEKDFTYYSHTTVNNDNTSNPQLPSAKFVYLCDEYTKNYNGEGTSTAPITYHIAYTYEYDHGNLIQKTDEGDTSVTTDDTQYNATYDYNSDNNLSLLRTEQTSGYLLSGQQGLISETDYNYKPNFLLNNKVMQNGTNSVTNSYGYDNWGNVTSVVDGNNNTTTISYDGNYQTFVCSKTNPMGQTETIGYDNLMNPTTAVDVNNITWQTTYDVFSRVKTKVSPGDDSTNPTSRITYPDEFVDTSGNVIFPNCQRLEQKISNGNYLEQDSYYDGLMRLVQKKTKAKNGWITIDYSYDSSGRLSKTSVPYFTTVATNTPANLSVATTLSYDPDDRVASSQNPDGTVIQTIYGKRETKTVDENGHVTSQIIVGNIDLGQSQNPKTPLLNSEAELRFTGIYPSQTEYSRTIKVSFGDGVQTTDAKGNIFTDQLDMLGRTISSTSPLNGTWTYSYDGNNNLISQTDAKNQTITVGYDSLNRITSKTYPNGSTVNYYYDEDGHGYAIGRLTRVVYANGEEDYTYDSRGRKSSITQTIGVVSRTKSMTYNSMDQIASLTYPDGEVVTNSFDQGGQVVGLSGNSSYVSAIGYTPLNKMSSMMYGNGVQTSYDYYDTASKLDSSANTYYSFGLRQIRASKTGTDLLNITYQYDKTGNVAVKSDNGNNNLSESYGYDEMNRLTGANAGIYGNKTFSYDQLDNILQKDGRIYQYDLAKPYTLTNDGRYGYTYDANGSMTGRSDGRTISWDCENRVTSISDGGSYGYSAQGQRIIKADANSTKYYFFPEYEEEYKAGVLSKSVKYYFVNKQRVAENSSTSGVRYYTKDHLGSSSAITDANGNLVLRTVNSPYGSEVYNQGTGDVAYKFTDKEKDNTGLDYFGARYYDPEVGRFISVDPAKDGGNWYEYCYDNPLKFYDPTGCSGILTIYSMQGDNTYGSFTFGNHSWISYTPDGSNTTTYYSTWGNEDYGPKGLQIDNKFDQNYSNDTSGDVSSRVEHINDEQETTFFNKVEDYAGKGENAWDDWNPCSSFASDTWNITTGESLQDRHFFGLGYSDPNVLKKSIDAANTNNEHSNQSSTDQSSTDLSYNATGGEF
jgi:RHS repeat-associated protein